MPPLTYTVVVQRRSGGDARAVCAIFEQAAEPSDARSRLDAHIAKGARSVRRRCKIDASQGASAHPASRAGRRQVVFRQQNPPAPKATENGRQMPVSVRTGYSTQVNHMSSNPWTLGSHPPAAADHADPTTGYPARILREQIEEAERAQRERVEQSSELNTPEMRIRAWERLHRLTLPLGSGHAVLDVIAKATRLTLEQVREEQRRRS